MAPWMWRGEQRGREGTVKFSVSNGKCVYMYRPRKQRLVRFFQRSGCPLISLYISLYIYVYLIGTEAQIVGLRFLCEARGAFLSSGEGAVWA